MLVSTSESGLALLQVPINAGTRKVSFDLFKKHYSIPLYILKEKDNMINIDEMMVKPADDKSGPNVNTIIILDQKIFTK